MLLLLLYESAARVSEIVHLRTSNFHLNRDNPYLHVLGKGRKERYIPIIDELATLLKEFIAFVVSSKDTDIVFNTMHGGKCTELSVRSVQTMLQEYASMARTYDASIPEHVHPHMCRYPNLISFQTFWCNSRRTRSCNFKGLDIIWHLWLDTFHCDWLYPTTFGKTALVLPFLENSLESSNRVLWIPWESEGIRHLDPKLCEIPTDFHVYPPQFDMLRIRWIEILC